MSATAAPGAIIAADEAGIARALECLGRGRAIAFPTETVYGLGADAASAAGVAMIYRIKARPADHPLIVHIASAAGIRFWAHADERADRLAAAFWPGPLTLILERRAGAPAWACGTQASIGLRCPSHPVAQRLLRAFEAAGGRGIAAPSANRYGRISPTRAEHVRDDLGSAVPLILDGGDAPIGLESTIVDLSGARPRLLRPGAITASAVAAVLGTELAGSDADAPRVSGSLPAHYAPRTPIELLAAHELAAHVRNLRAAGLRLAIWSRTPPPEPAGDWHEAAREAGAYAHALYETLRRLDRLKVDRLVIEAPPPGEAWDAVRDRLGRAAAGARPPSGTTEA